MTDIVKRLTAKDNITSVINTCTCKPGRHPADLSDLMKEAADAIERLRLELDMVQATILVPSQKDDRRTIERLRAENERLREAIKKILDDSFGQRQRTPFTNVRSISVGTLVAVREALGEME